MSQDALNAYNIMWALVLFDLPTNTKAERKSASQFRKFLLQDGFAMLQFSVYIRHCASKESLAAHVGRIKLVIPARGQVSILCITDKQYGNIQNFWGKETEPLPPAPLQLELF